MSDGRPRVCGESESWGAELALGLLSGPDRSAGLSHVAACPACRQQVDELARVADRLLVLAPSAEPPAGFESKILAAVGGAAAPGEAGARRTERRGGGGRLVALVATLVVAAAVGGGVVGAALRAPSPRESNVLRTGLAVSSSGRTSCRVVVSGTRPASVLVSMDGYPGSEPEFLVEMVTVAGAAVPVGPMPVVGGHGLLVRSLDLEADTLRTMRMLDREGRVVYEATLAPAG